MSTLKKILGLVCVLIPATQVALADSGFSVGAEYSEGDYGTGETSRSWYIPLGWRYRGGDFSTSITVPYLIVEGSSLVTAGGTPLSPSGMGGGGGGAGGGGGGTTNTTRYDSGLGDVVVSASYQLLSESSHALWLGTTAKVKFGTADESKALGTGENDYTLQLEAARGALYGYAGYRVIGDTASVDYNDVAFAGVSLNMPLGKMSEWSVGYYAEEASVTGMDDVQEATLSVGGEFSKGLDYSLYYIAGLSDGSADSTIGVNFSSRLK